MDRTAHLDLPFILPSQAQKHVTHNEALSRIDTVTQLSVISRGLGAPPPSAVEGDRYIIAPGGSGDWSGHDGEIAVHEAGGWSLIPPAVGWLAFVADEQRLLVHDGAEWAPLVDAAINPAGRVGVNTMADATNRLAVKSDAVLMSHDDVTPGNGDIRMSLNKAGEAGTASVTFQTSWSGRAEFGLAGDDDWHVKVSADGGLWKEALVADSVTGRVRFPSGLSHAESGASLSNIIFTPGGDGQVSVVRLDRPRDPDPRMATLASITGDILTLVSADADLFFHPYMRGVSLVRIWNTSKATPEPAWIKYDPAYGAGNDQLQVTNPADIAGWMAGEVIQLGDQAGWPGVPANFVRGYAVDLSPMLQNRLGAVFRQKAITFKCIAFGVTGRTGMSVTPNGTGGSYVGGNSLSDGQANITQHTAATTELSPISTSNLVWVREDGDPGDCSIMGISIIGVWV